MKQIRYVNGTTDDVDADQVSTSVDNTSWFVLTKAGAEVGRVNTAQVSSIIDVPTGA